MSRAAWKSMYTLYSAEMVLPLDARIGVRASAHADIGFRLYSPRGCWTVALAHARGVIANGSAPAELSQIVAAALVVSPAAFNALLACADNTP
jgi:hypothetical protein